MRHYILFLIVFSSFISIAQIPGSVDFSFGKPVNAIDDSSRVAGDIPDALVLPDGRIVIVGMSAYNYHAVNGIARLNRLGIRDIYFATGTGFIGYPYCIIGQPDGKFIVGGDFTSYNNFPCHNIVRLDSTGAFDSTFYTQTGFDEAVRSLAYQSWDNKIVVGGEFEQFDTTHSSGIIRLNPDGKADTSFHTGYGFNYPKILSIAIQPDHKIIAGGHFQYYNNIPCKNLYRIDTIGTADTTFKIRSGFDDIVKDIKLKSNGKIIVCGNFQTCDSDTAPGIVQLDSIGIRDTTFKAEFIGGGNCSTIRPDGKILATGWYLNKDSILISAVRLLDSTGVDDSLFHPMYDGNGDIHKITIEPGGTILLTGFFGVFDRTLRGSIARLDSNGHLDQFAFRRVWGFELAEPVRVVELPDHSILYAGPIRFYNDRISYGIVKVFPDGEVDTTFHNGFDQYVEVTDVAVDAINNYIYLVGQFYKYQNAYATRIVRIYFDGTLDTTFNTGPGFDNDVYTCSLQNDGKLLVGGYFNSYNGWISKKLVRVNTDGSLDVSFPIGQGFSGSVTSIRQQPDGKILVGGYFTGYQSQYYPHIIRLNSDATIDATFQIGNGLDDKVNVFAIQPDNKILVGGIFSNYDLQNTGKLIRLETNGQRDTTYHTYQYGDIKDLIIQPDGNVLVDVVLGQNAGRIMRLKSDGSEDSTFNTGNQLSNRANDIELQSDGRLLTCGVFTQYQIWHVRGTIRLYSGLALSIPDFDKESSITVYPNPTENIIYFKLNINEGEESIISIADLTGQLLFSERSFSSNGLLELNYPDGIYFLTVKLHEGVYSKKIVIAH